MTYTKLIERLESDIALTPVSAIAREAADAIEALQSQLDAMGKGEPIYQYQMGDGSWIDQTKHSYDYNRNHAPNAVVRIVYAAPKALAPLTDEQVVDIAKALRMPFNMEFVRAIEAAHGIGGTP